jgi:sugar phosphate isomerase/epimerase
VFLSIVTDEVSLDPLTAVELGQEWGLSHFELRSVASGRLPDISDADRRRLVALSRRTDIVLTAMSPGFFKNTLDDPITGRQFREGLPRALDLATELGIGKMIFFAARKDNASRNEASRRVADLLARCAEECSKANVLLLLENEHICWADTGIHALDVLEHASHPNMRLNWDPCNCVWAGGSPYPTEYERVRKHIVHLHVKDTCQNRRGEFVGVPVGDGEVGWRSILHALRSDGYVGPYTVETHYTPKVASSRHCVENLKRLLLECD